MRLFAYTDITTSPFWNNSVIWPGEPSNDSTLGAIVAWIALKPGSMLSSLPPLMRAMVTSMWMPCVVSSPGTRIILRNFGSPRSVQEVGAAQPLSAKIFVL